MDVQVNWLGIILATISTLVVGFIWYTPKVFGNAWMQLAKVDRKQAEKAGMMPIIITIMVSFVTAYVLAHVTFLSNHFFQNSYLQDALSTAFWLWLGLVAARIITHDLFEGRPRQLTLLTIGHEFVTLMVMGLVIGLLKP